MWPEAVERIAIFLRASGVEGRLEELLDEAERPPGMLLDVSTFECSSGALVALVPAGRSVDEDKVARAAGCTNLRGAAAREFPFQGAKVLLDRAALTASTVWLDLGSPRHLLGLAPGQLAHLTGAETPDLVAEGQNGGG
jgi:prolyl-tRNA editing enzyme YbaK/EbsC (Cys-tRNA(Pro) deacylase)